MPFNLVHAGHVSVYPATSIFTARILEDARSTFLQNVLSACLCRLTPYDSVTVIPKLWTLLRHPTATLYRHCTNSYAAHFLRSVTSSLQDTARISLTLQVALPCSQHPVPGQTTRTTLHQFTPSYRHSFISPNLTFPSPSLSFRFPN
jgi:hypothetical protein